MDDSFSTVPKNIKQKAVTEFFMHKNEAPIGIHMHLLAFYGKENISAVCCWKRKSRDNIGNLDLKDELQSERSVTTTHDLNRQKFKKLTQEH